MTKPVLSHARSLTIHIGRAAIVRHDPGVHSTHLYTEAGDACGVWHAGVQVRPREAEEVTRLDDQSQLGGGVHGLTRLWHQGSTRPARADIFQVPICTRVL